MMYPIKACVSNDQLNSKHGYLSSSLSVLGHVPEVKFIFIEFSSMRPGKSFSSTLSLLSQGSFSLTSLSDGTHIPTKTDRIFNTKLGITW